MDDCTQMFQKLLDQSTELFAQSRLKSSQEQKKVKWGMSLCATPLAQKKGILLGINWGGGNGRVGDNYDVQAQMPTRTDFLDAYLDGQYRFIKNSRELLNKCLDIDVESDPLQFNYTNLCFFRSPDVSHISFSDVEVCLPIIRQLIEFIDPPWILSLGNSNMKYLEGDIKDLKTTSKKGTNQKNQFGYAGTLWGKKFYCVPHPNAKWLTKDIRSEIWKSVFSC